jgi:hypothetical protein
VIDASQPSFDLSNLSALGVGGGGGGGAGARVEDPPQANSMLVGNSNKRERPCNMGNSLGIAGERPGQTIKIVWVEPFGARRSSGVSVCRPLPVPEQPRAMACRR